MFEIITKLGKALTMLEMHENLLNIIIDFQWSPKGLEEIVNRIQKDILKERLSPLAIQSKMNLPNKFPDH